MGHQVMLPITAGTLDLGPWEQVFYAEFDGQRRKRVVVKVMGNRDTAEERRRIGASAMCERTWVAGVDARLVMPRRDARPSGAEAEARSAPTRLGSTARVSTPAAAAGGLEERPERSM